MALDPDYGSKKTRELVYGGTAGQLTLVTRVSHLFTSTRREINMSDQTGW